MGPNFLTHTTLVEWRVYRDGNELARQAIDNIEQTVFTQEHHKCLYTHMAWERANTRT